MRKDMWKEVLNISAARYLAFKDSFKTIQEAQEHLLARVSELNERPGTDQGDSAPAKLELERRACIAIMIAWKVLQAKT